MPATGRSHAVETSVHHPLAPLLRWLKDVTMRLQAQRARTALLQEVVGLMLAAGIDAFIGNTSEELAMANLASLPTMAVPLGTQPLLNAANSTRKFPLSLGIFGSPQTDANVGPRSQDGPCHKHCAPAMLYCRPACFIQYLLIRCLRRGCCIHPQTACQWCICGWYSRAGCLLLMILQPFLACQGWLYSCTTG